MTVISSLFDAGIKFQLHFNIVTIAERQLLSQHTYTLTHLYVLFQGSTGKTGKRGSRGKRGDKVTLTDIPVV